MMRAVSVVEVRLWIAAVVAFALFAALGALVSSRPPTAIDLAAGALRGEATSLATFFTALGRTPALLAIVVAALVAAVMIRASIVPVAALAISQVASQGVIAALKPVFHRTRPDRWLLYKESDLSFPSGHATSSVVFFFALLLLVLRTPELPRPAAIALATLAGICVVGIPWSRLALGAHYATDVTGGLLFGAAWLCASLALLIRFGVFA